MGKEKLETLCPVLQIFCKQIMNLLMYSVLIIMSNHSETSDQNSVESLICSPHPAKHIHTDTQRAKGGLDKFGW